MYMERTRPSEVPSISLWYICHFSDWCVRHKMHSCWQRAKAQWHLSLLTFVAALIALARIIRKLILTFKCWVVGRERAALHLHPNIRSALSHFMTFPQVGDIRIYLALTRFAVLHQNVSWIGIATVFHVYPFRTNLDLCTLAMITHHQWSALSILISFKSSRFYAIA